VWDKMLLGCCSHEADAPVRFLVCIQYLREKVVDIEEGVLYNIEIVKVSLSNALQAAEM
jgi:hypothetical protein